MGPRIWPNCSTDRNPCFLTLHILVIIISTNWSKIVKASSPNYLKGSMVEDFPDSSKRPEIGKNPPVYQKPYWPFTNFMESAIKWVWDDKIRQVDATKRPKIVKLSPMTQKFDTNFAKFVKSLAKIFHLRNFCPFLTISFFLNFNQNLIIPGWLFRKNDNFWDFWWALSHNLTLKFTKTATLGSKFSNLVFWPEGRHSEFL